MHYQVVLIVCVYVYIIYTKLYYKLQCSITSRPHSQCWKKSGRCLPEGTLGCRTYCSYMYKHMYKHMHVSHLPVPGTCYELVCQNRTRRCSGFSRRCRRTLWGRWCQSSSSIWETLSSGWPAYWIPPCCSRLWRGGPMIFDPPWWPGPCRD